MRGNYDRIAGFYDRLARLVFGQSINLAQQFLVDAIPAGARVLVVGGGTGWILELMAERHSRGLDITYIELSQNMISRAKKRNPGGNKVTFIAKAVQEVELGQHFDVVLTPFLFDNFSEASLRQVFAQLDNVLCKDGRWLFADFQFPQKRLSHRLLLKGMYLFFGLLCSLETLSLPDSAAQFRQGGYSLEKEALFYKDFICSRIYRKRSTENQ